MQIDPSLRGVLPPVADPAPFASPDGRLRGWKVTIPGQRPLATPAVAAGRVFLGGGFGSYDFYALDAKTGRVAWQYQTTDDGPTAAAVHEDFVAFNTESCELEVLTVDGRPLWKKWLGDPLMSMPAMSAGRVYVVFPDSRGDHRHYLAAFDLAGGTELWRQPLAGEIITAPVLADGHVYVTTLDGTLYCCRQADGRLLWHETKNATSSPVVWQGQCYFSQRQESARTEAGRKYTQQSEQLVSRGFGADADTRSFPGTLSPADYLDHGKRLGGSPVYRHYEAYEAAVGFAAHKGDAKMEQARKNLGHGQVSAVWAYQGSKPFLAGRRLYSCLGDTLFCADPDSRAVSWQRMLYDRKGAAELLDSVLTPPVLVNDKIFLGTCTGDLCCLSAASGELLWRVPLGEPIVFQPAVVGGRVFVGTRAGSVFGLKTGDGRDDGWAMWGATAAHNGLV
jgi:outer membrane protein assembly factor BamB